MPTTSTIIGYIASGLVLTTFWTNDMRRLRILAILSNIAFISYGALVGLPPVLGLHLLLLPLNTVRLMRMSKTAPDAHHRKFMEAPVTVPAVLATVTRLLKSEGAHAHPAEVGS
jgi:hypothetical protein